MPKPLTPQLVRHALLLLLAAGHVACGDSPAAPSTRALVTMQVGASIISIVDN